MAHKFKYCSCHSRSNQILNRLFSSTWMTQWPVTSKYLYISCFSSICLSTNHLQVITATPTNLFWFECNSSWAYYFHWNREASGSLTLQTHGVTLTVLLAWFGLLCLILKIKLLTVLQLTANNKCIKMTTKKLNLEPKKRNQSNRRKYIRNSCVLATDKFISLLQWQRSSSSSSSN